MKRLILIAVALALSACAAAPEHKCNPMNGACSYGDEHSESKTLKFHPAGKFYI
jgi:hypothetical protein